MRGPMLDLIGYDRQYDAVATYLLGDVLVVEDLERALALWRETRTSKTIVTLEGEVIDPHGVVTGGSRESALAGVLEQKREIRELEAVMERLDADVEAALARHVAQEAGRRGSRSRCATRGRVALRADEMALLGQQKDLERLVEERRRLEARRAALAVQTVDLDAGPRGERGAARGGDDGARPTTERRWRMPSGARASCGCRPWRSPTRSIAGSPS